MMTSEEWQALGIARTTLDFETAWRTQLSNFSCPASRGDPVPSRRVPRAVDDVRSTLCALCQALAWIQPSHFQKDWYAMVCPGICRRDLIGLFLVSVYFWLFLYVAPVKDENNNTDSYSFHNLHKHTISTAAENLISSKQTTTKTR